MAIIKDHWILFEYIGAQMTPLSKPVKSKALAEQARGKFPERDQRAIGVGVVKTTG
jgi:hypothetical protein